MPSYSSLQTYRKCPRLYGFKLLGFSPIEVPEAIQTGSFVHTAIAAHFKGTSWEEAIIGATREAIAGLDKLDSEKQAKAYKKLDTSTKRATDLASRYISQWTMDYSTTLVETWLDVGGVRGIVDLIATYQEQRVIVDYKTSKSPDMRWYDVSGQIDLYAYMLEQYERETKLVDPAIHPHRIKLVIYDIIADEGIYRQVRPPRLEAGHKLYQEIEAMAMYSDTGRLLEHSHFTFDCPQRCDYWMPCWLLETADWSACEDYLKANFIKEEK